MSQEEDPRMLEEVRERIEIQKAFERTEPGSDPESYDRALRRAVEYRGIDPDLAEIYLDQAIDVISEVQINFQNSIIDQVSRMSMIVNEMCGGAMSEPEDSRALEEIARFINSEIVDIEEANRHADDVAIKMGRMLQIEQEDIKNN